jgi:hypothetical protein
VHLNEAEKEKLMSHARVANKGLRLLGVAKAVFMMIPCMKFSMISSLNL